MLKIIQTYKSIEVKPDFALINHILSEIKDDHWSNPINIFKDVQEHLREHEVDEPIFYVTSAYIFLMLSEVKQNREEGMQQLLKFTALKKDVPVH